MKVPVEVYELLGVDPEPKDNPWPGSTKSFCDIPYENIKDAPDMYLWDDYDEVRDRLQQAQENNEELFGYTLIEAEGEGYIDKGFRLVNRLGYFLADKDIEMNEPICYW